MVDGRRVERPTKIEEQETVPAQSGVTQVDAEHDSEDDIEMNETARRLDAIMAAIAASDRRGDERQWAADRRWDDRLQMVVTQFTEHTNEQVEILEAPLRKAKYHKTIGVMTAEEEETDGDKKAAPAEE